MDEYACHQCKKRNADLQSAVQGRIKRSVGNLGRDGGDQRRRGRQLTPDTEEKREEMHDPWIDADPDHRRSDHDCNQDIGRRRRQPGAEDRAEYERQHDHGGEVHAGEID